MHTHTHTPVYHAVRYFVISYCARSSNSRGSKTFDRNFKRYRFLRSFRASNIRTRSCTRSYVTPVYNLINNEHVFVTRNYGRRSLFPSLCAQTRTQFVSTIYRRRRSLNIVYTYVENNNFRRFSSEKFRRNSLYVRIYSY